LIFVLTCKVYLAILQIKQFWIRTRSLRDLNETFTRHHRDLHETATRQLRDYHETSTRPLLPYCRGIVGVKQWFAHPFVVLREPCLRPFSAWWRRKKGVNRAAKPLPNSAKTT